MFSAHSHPLRPQVMNWNASFGVFMSLVELWPESWSAAVKIMLPSELRGLCGLRNPNWSHKSTDWKMNDTVDSNAASRNIQRCWHRARRYEKWKVAFIKRLYIGTIVHLPTLFWLRSIMIPAIIQQKTWRVFIEDTEKIHKDLWPQYAQTFEY